MKQRLAIASCLLGDPAVLVFDEPTNGLDPSGIAEIRQLIIDLAKKAKRSFWPVICWQKLRKYVRMLPFCSRVNY